MNEYVLMKFFKFNNISVTVIYIVYCCLLWAVHDNLNLFVINRL